MYRLIRTTEGRVDPGLFERLVCISVADRFLHPELYTGEGRDVNDTCLARVAARNEGLAHVFPQLLGGLSCGGEQEDMLQREINRWVNGVSLTELLHMPGRIHEALMIRKPDSANVLTDRKVRGSYYTPSYVVRQMVRSSFTHMPAGSGITKYKTFRALDPACGGACFLLEVYNHLVELGWDPGRAAGSVFGIDIDAAAVELSIFVLTLKILEGHPVTEAAEIKSRLGGQIKVGNALSARFGNLLEKSAGNIRHEIRWDQEFPGVFGEGMPEKEKGFDLVLGNPPYVSNKLIPSADKRYYREHYRSADKQYDLSVPFLEQGLNLLKENGVLCYITSNKFMGSEYGLKLRQILLHENTINELIDVSTLKTFIDAAAYPVIISVSRKQAPPGSRISILTVTDWQEIAASEPAAVEQGFFTGIDGNLISTALDHRTLPVIRKIADHKWRIPRRIIRCGLAETGFNRWVTGNAAGAECTGSECTGSDSHLAPFIQAGQIKPHRVEGVSLIDERQISRGKKADMEEDKIVIPGIARTLTAAVDCQGCLLGRVYYIKGRDLGPDLECLTVLLNSKVLGFYYRVMYWPVHLEGGYLRFNSGYIADLPLCLDVNCSDGPGELAGLAEMGRKLRELPPGSLEAKDTAVQADAAVFALYGISRDEASIIMDFLDTEKHEREKIIEIMMEESTEKAVVRGVMDGRKEKDRPGCI